MEDRHGVPRSGAYVENMCSGLDPWKEILAGMRMLPYHEMCDIVRNSGVEHTGNHNAKNGQYCEMRSTDARVAGWETD